MNIEMYLSMAGFALAASISPGPVNIVALSSGAQFGFRSSLRHVTGATVGFTALLVLIGVGLHELLQLFPMLIQILQVSGMLFLLYMAYQLARDDGQLGNANIHTPSFYNGALMQWLNPKAWLASVAGMGAYAADGSILKIYFFAAIYCVVCYFSIATWAYIGAFLKKFLGKPQRMRLFNRFLASTLVMSCIYLLKSQL